MSNLSKTEMDDWVRRTERFTRTISHNTTDAATTEMKHGDFVFIDPKTQKEDKIRVDVSHRNGDVKAYEMVDGNIVYNKDECVKIANKHKVNAIKHNIKQMQEYVTWQEGRIANWVEKDLTPVTK